jgi:peroxiredoxin
MSMFLPQLFLLLFCFSACRTTAPTKGDNEYDTYIRRTYDGMKGKPAPDIEFIQTDGKQMKISELRGQIVLLNFWFAACKPCITEIASLNELHNKYSAQGVKIVSISTDDHNVAHAAAINHKILYTVAAHGKMEAETYKVKSFPTTFLIDREGIIREVFFGASDWDATQTYMEINPVLEKMIGNK